jgi:hypothetical protein
MAHLLEMSKVLFSQNARNRILVALIRSASDVQAETISSAVTSGVIAANDTDGYATRQSWAGQVLANPQGYVDRVLVRTLQNSTLMGEISGLIADTGTISDADETQLDSDLQFVVNSLVPTLIASKG